MGAKKGQLHKTYTNEFKQKGLEGFPKLKSAEEQKLIAFDWIWFYMNKRISLPKKITKNKVFNYDKAIEKNKEFEKLKLKKIKLN